MFGIKINIEIMPMMKNYTLSYYFSYYQNCQPECKKVDYVRMEGDNMLQDLHEFPFEPSEKSVQKILNFSKSYEVLSSTLTSSIEVIKN
jgi:hypothetical protein